MPASRDVWASPCLLPLGSLVEAGQTKERLQKFCVYRCADSSTNPPLRPVRTGRVAEAVGTSGFGAVIRRTCCSYSSGHK